MFILRPEITFSILQYTFQLSLSNICTVSGSLLNRWKKLCEYFDQVKIIITWVMYLRLNIFRQAHRCSILLKNYISCWMNEGFGGTDGATSISIFQFSLSLFSGHVQNDLSFVASYALRIRYQISKTKSSIKILSKINLSIVQKKSRLIAIYIH